MVGISPFFHLSIKVSHRLEQSHQPFARSPGQCPSCFSSALLDPLAEWASASKGTLLSGSLFPPLPLPSSLCSACWLSSDPFVHTYHGHLLLLTGHTHTPHSLQRLIANPFHPADPFRSPGSSRPVCLLLCVEVPESLLTAMFLASKGPR